MNSYLQIADPLLVTPGTPTSFATEQVSSNAKRFELELSECRLSKQRKKYYFFTVTFSEVLVNISTNHKISRLALQTEADFVYPNLNNGCPNASLYSDIKVTIVYGTMPGNILAHILVHHDYRRQFPLRSAQHMAKI